MSNQKKDCLSKLFNKFAAIGATAVVLTSGMALPATASAGTVARADREVLRYTQQICERDFNNKYTRLKSAWDRGSKRYNYNDYLKIRNKYTKCTSQTSKKSWTTYDLRKQGRSWEKRELANIRAEERALLRRANKIKNKSERQDEIRFIRDQSSRDQRSIEDQSRKSLRDIERFEDYGGTSISKWGPLTIRSYSGNGRYGNNGYNYNNYGNHNYNHNNHGNHRSGGSSFHWSIGR